MTRRVFVGVLQLSLVVPGARTRKDRRQVVHSLRDRVRSRFEVTCSEIPDEGRPLQGDIVMTTAGPDGKVVRAALDRVRSFVEGDGRAWVGEANVEVFRWHPPDRWSQAEDEGGDDG